MNILIITAHPKEASLNGEILKRVQANLPKSHSIKVLDLYQENFDPVLHYERRRDMKDDPSAEKYRQLITWADQLIFIFPIWWGGMPAILKGFIDRVFAAGFAYSYKGIMPVGHLKGKKAWIITTHDTPVIFAKLFQQDYGHILKKQVLAMCGIKPTKLTAIPYVRGTSDDILSKQLDKIGLLAQKI
ncbi:NAD(P)H-dependent oxidoreductase [Streptococcus downei]|uniref:Oxidoreductase n=1 Tax=Streptococcus downei MFe28 TaxID=764290 RepID=A0A380JG14_STRDO|nr:NAD(P)H-dependent oxidoreductase [Streptococcus downei]EFQ56699.1 flavodoxin-like protein [Streptococcus downei F0415]SUN35986.1 oxidoreductase [Streptococcus downei MFe28]